jgi:large subunit ribosomal protein L15
VKLHDLKPAPGSRKQKRRVGRGIAAGQGKTAGRGTKGQKARAGGTIPAWFEGGQTPLHQRIPKLRGFVNKFKIDYEVVNVGDIARLVELGELEAGDMPGTKAGKGGPAPVTVNQEILRAAGLVRRLDRPMKVLGGGELSAALFVVADAFSGTARSKIEAAGGTVSVLEVPGERRAAPGVESDEAPAGSDVEDTSGGATASPADAASEPEKKPRRGKAVETSADAEAEDAAPADADAAEADADAVEAAPADEAKPRARKPRGAKTESSEISETDA